MVAWKRRGRRLAASFNRILRHNDRSPLNVTENASPCVPGTEHKEEMAKRLPSFLAHPNWAGVGGIAGVIGTLVAIWAVLPSGKPDGPGKDSGGGMVSTESPPPETDQPVVAPAPPATPAPIFPEITTYPTHVRVEVEPIGILALCDAQFQQKVSAEVDGLSSQIEKCFSGYRASDKFMVDYGVQVVALPDKIIVPRNQISNPYPNDLPDEDVEKMRDVISQASFPPPNEAKCDAVEDKYSFLIKLTFVPSKGGNN